MAGTGSSSGVVVGVAGSSAAGAAGVAAPQQGWWGWGWWHSRHAVVPRLAESQDPPAPLPPLALPLLLLPLPLVLLPLLPLPLPFRSCRIDLLTAASCQAPLACVGRQHLWP